MEKKREQSRPALAWPMRLTKNERRSAEKQLEGLEDPQVLLDELQGRMSKREILEPLRYFAKLVKLAKEGAFIPELADQVRESREREAARAAIAEQSAQRREVKTPGEKTKALAEMHRIVKKGRHTRERDK